MTIEEHYIQTRKQKAASSVSEHMPILRGLADECQHVTEFGVMHVNSTWAFLASRCPVVVSYDWIREPNVGLALEVCRRENRHWLFIKADVREIVIDETDLLFIDTEHLSAQLEIELQLHKKNVRRFIVLHDTVLRWEDLQEAVMAHLAADPEWALFASLTNCCGLQIWERQP